MKIIGSQPSPFVRIPRIVCSELGLSYDFEIMPPFAKMTAENKKHVQDHNPLMKIPVLIDGDQTVIDSRVIANYLLKKHKPNAALSIDEENTLSMIYGIMDAGVLRFIMNTEGLDLNTGYMKKSADRIQSGLDFLNRQTHLGKDFGLCEIVLLSALDWFDKRAICEWRQYENLVKLYTMFKDRPSLIETRIPDSA